MPANDGRRPHVDHGIAPIEHSGEQGKADACRVIQASGFDTALDITRELLAKNQVLSADRAGRRKNETTSLRTSKATPTIARASCSIAHHARVEPAVADVGHECTRSANYCGAQADATEDMLRRIGTRAMLSIRKHRKWR